MRNARAEVFCYLIVAGLFFSPFSYAVGNDTHQNKPCDIHKADDQCGKYGTCAKDESDEEPRCKCLIDYELVNGQCVHVLSTVSVSTTTALPELKSSSEGSSVAAGLLIPTFLIVIGVLLYFGARRYKWLQRFRQFRPNRYGNVLVTRDDDDDDDPPLA